MERDPYLQAMGITQWQRRERTVHDELPVPVATDTAIVTPQQEQENVVERQVAEPVVQPRTDTDTIHSLGWEALEAHVRQCTACELHATRSNTVFGAGDRNADWLIIGEAPGADEDRLGEPFVGRAGQLLTSMIFSIGYKREQVYIANILKCRPSGNRDPRPEEVLNCQHYLRRQIELLQPKIILAVGRVAAQNLLDTDKPMKSLRGQQFKYADTGIPLVVSYHPAYLLRSPLEKRKVWQDLKLARQIYAGTL